MLRGGCEQARPDHKHHTRGVLAEFGSPPICSPLCSQNNFSQMQSSRLHWILSPCLKCLKSLCGLASKAKSFCKASSPFSTWRCLTSKPTSTLAPFSFPPPPPFPTAGNHSMKNALPPTPSLSNLSSFR